MTERDEEPTDPDLHLTPEDIMSWLVGSVQRIELKLTELCGIVNRIEALETKVKEMKTVCVYRHENGSSHLR